MHCTQDLPSDPPHRPPCLCAAQIPEDSDGDELKAQLGVSVLPTIRFFKSGRLLWQQEGYLGMTNQLGEGAWVRGWGKTGAYSPVLCCRLMHLQVSRFVAFTVGWRQGARLSR
jgi:hypothetical protein